MGRFAVFLRGVNVGKGHRLPMADFRQVLLGVGCADVTTLLNSGNAAVSASVRTADRLARAIHDALVAGRDLDMLVVVKSAAELANVIDSNTLAAEAHEPSRLLVVLSQDPAALRALSAVDSLIRPPERFAVGPHAAYLYCATGISESAAAKALLGKPGRALTTRNWATVLKLRALLAPESGNVTRA